MTDQIFSVILHRDDLCVAWDGIGIAREFKAGGRGRSWDSTKAWVDRVEGGHGSYFSGTKACRSSPEQRWTIGGSGLHIGVAMKANSVWSSFQFQLFGASSRLNGIGYFSEKYSRPAREMQLLPDDLKGDHHLAQHAQVVQEGVFHRSR